MFFWTIYDKTYDNFLHNLMVFSAISSTNYTVNCAKCTVYCAKYTVNCAVCTVGAICTVNCAFCTVKFNTTEQIAQL